MHIEDEKTEAATAGGAVRLPLTGGRVMRTCGAGLHRVAAAAEPPAVA